MEFLRHVVRFIVSALVLMFVGFIVPQFSVGGFWSALMLALVIAAAGWIAEAVFGKRISPFGRGIIGFLASAIIIWIAQYIVDGISVTLFGALLAALVIGIIDLFIPVSTPFDDSRERSRAKV